MKIWLAIFLLFSFKVFAQYPFEKYHSIKYKKVAFTISKMRKDSSFAATAIYKNYKVVLIAYAKSGDADIVLLKNNKIIKRINNGGIDLITINNPLYIGDIDGNGLIDFKIDLFNNGSGLAGSRESKIYLFNNDRDDFTKVSFMDFFSNIERDFDGDKNYEIITQTLIRYGDHSYWLFDLYNYINGEFIKVSDKRHYPIAIQYLDRENYKVSNKISYDKLKRLSPKYPDFFSEDK